MAFSETFAASIVDITITILIILVGTAACRKRTKSLQSKAKTPTKPVAKVASTATRATKPLGVKQNTTSGYQSTTSTNDLDSSDNSRDASDNSRDGSDAESSDQAAAKAFTSTGMAATPPPGLEPLMPQVAQDRPQSLLKSPALMRKQAAPFVPTSGGCAAPGALPSLQEVVGKLSREDAATVMAALNSASSKNGLVGVGAKTDPPARAFRPWTQPRPQARNNSTRSGNTTGREEGTGSLRDNLVQLSRLDSNSVILVRKIAKLGLNSGKLLEAYFARYGEVERVFVTHSQEKGNRGNVRWRPAGVGFVAMKKAEDAAAAINAAHEHVVLGVTITLGAYQDNYLAKASME